MAVIPFSASGVLAPEPSGSTLADASERASALDISASWIVEAPAGSGKTGLLIQRFLKLLARVSDPVAVLALTFTEKATAEMRDRIVAALRTVRDRSYTIENDFDRLTYHLAEAALQQDTNEGWQLLEHPYRLNIRTIDSFCNEIARALPLLSDGVGHARPLRDANPLYRRAAHAVMMRFGDDDTALNEDIRTVLLHRDGNLMYCEGVLAAMLGTREQWNQLIPLEGDALTDEALDRAVLPRLNGALERTLCAALTQLHACFPEHLLQRIAGVARQLASADGYNDDPNPFVPCASFTGTLGREAQHLDHWLMVARLMLTKEGKWRSSLSSKYLKAALSKELRSGFRQLLRDLREDAGLAELLHAVNDLPPAVYPAAQWAVAKALFRLLRYTLEELHLLFVREDVCDFTAIALAARSALKDHVSSPSSLDLRVDHILVDEMQDTSSVQYELLEDLTAGWDGRSRTVFLVGDPKQSIYLFRQARVERFQKAMKQGEFAAIPLGTLRLCTNFRSGRRLVQAFNETFSQVFSREAAEVGDVTYTPATAVRPAQPDEELNWMVNLLPFTAGDTEASRGQRILALKNEAASITDRIQTWRARHGTASKIAILTRSRTHVTEITKDLAKARIPFRAVEMEALGERQEVLDILAITRALLHPADRTAWLAVLRAPWCGAALAHLHILASGDGSKQRQQALRPHLPERTCLLPEPARARLFRTLDVMDAALSHTGTEPLARRVERTWRSLGGDACIDDTGRENVRLFLRVLDTMEAEGESVTAHTLAARLDRLYADPSHAPDAIDVMTIHKAKGLEWDLVIIPGTHRPPARDAWPLLNWLELPTTAPDGTRDVLFAPLPSSTGDAGLLNTYIKKIRNGRSSAEVKRLLYVAATRARTSLQLVAWPEEKKDGGASRVKDTLFGVAQHTIPEQAWAEQDSANAYSNGISEPLALAAAADQSGTPPPRRLATIQRLTGGYDPLEQLRRAALPPMRHAAMPPRFPRPEGSFGARAVGSVIHAFIERLIHECAAFPDSSDTDTLTRHLLSGLDTWRSAIRTALASGGLPPGEVERASQTVHRALRTLLESPDGRWLLRPHRQAATESSWRSAYAGETRQVRLDRSFFAGPQPHAPGEDTLWIVDFKTGDHDLDRDAFLQEERLRYEPQLRTYADVMLRSYPAATPVMLALFYPLMGRLVYWPYTEEVMPRADVPPISHPSAASNGKVQLTLFS